MMSAHQALTVVKILSCRDSVMILQVQQMIKPGYVLVSLVVDPQAQLWVVFQESVFFLGHQLFGELKKSIGIVQLLQEHLLELIKSAGIGYKKIANQKVVDDLGWHRQKFTHAAPMKKSFIDGKDHR